MKKLLLSTIILLLTYSAISQTSNKPQQKDSCTCISNAKLRLAAEKIENGQRDSMLLKICKDDNQYFKARIDLKDLKITELQGKVADYKYLEQSYQLETQNLIQQKEIAIAGMEQANKKLKGQKRKTIFGIIGSTIVTLTIGYFYTRTL